MILKLISCGILARSTAFHAKADDAAGAPEKPKTLAEAHTRLTDLEGKVSAAEQRATDAEAKAETEKQRAERAEADLQSANSQFESATQAAEAAKAELATATATIGTITGERDTAKADLGKAQANITRLEKLCGLKGIDPSQAAEDIGEHSSTSDLDGLRAQLAAEKDPVRRYELAKQARALRTGTAAV
jgi:DNA repair exonuclease SbcCD ATPase subunit